MNLKVKLNTQNSWISHLMDAIPNEAKRLAHRKCHDANSPQREDDPNHEPQATTRELAASQSPKEKDTNIIRVLEI
jgi:hypothetical protein